MTNILKTCLAWYGAYIIFDHWRREKVRVRVRDSRYIIGNRIVIIPELPKNVYTTECSALLPHFKDSKSFVENNSHKLTYTSKPYQYPVFEYKKARSFLWKSIYTLVDDF